MKLISLILNNFKGIKSFEFTPNGDNVAIFGDNATGKTTVNDAFLWLLFSKDSNGKKDFEIKTLDASGKVIHGLEHEVSAVIEHSGKRTGLRKVYAEKWAKKRGSATSEFTGNETNYWIDGVPVKAGEYAGFIGDIADEEAFKLLTSPGYFNEQLHWQKRRDLILQVCGDLTDVEVIAGNKELAALPGILGDRKLEDHKKVIAARRAELNKEIEKIPVRIDEVFRGLPDIAGLEVGPLNESIATLRAKESGLRDRLAQVQSGGEMAQAKTDLQLVSAEILRIKNEHEAGLRDKVSGKQDELSRLQGESRKIYIDIDAANRTAMQSQNGAVLFEQKRDNLRALWGAENEKVFSMEQDANCPACGQGLPEDKLTEARTRAEEQFNLAKAEKLAQISADGKEVAAKIAELTEDAKKHEAAAAELTKKVAGIDSQIQQLQAEIEPSKSDSNIETHQPYVDAMAKKKGIEDKIASLATGNTEAVAEINNQITDIALDISTLEYSLRSVKSHEDGKKRIDELKAEEKRLAAEFEKLEGELYLAELFIKTKVAMLEDKINNRFKLARFKMFDLQINGGIAETCVTTFNGVPYPDLNNAMKINIGLDIINTLSEHYGFFPTIIIDNAEAVTKLIGVKAQVVRLVVSEAHKKLTVEAETKEAVA